MLDNKKLIRMVFSILLILYMGILVITYSTNVFGDETRELLQQILFLIAPMVSLVGGVYALKRFGVKSSFGRMILLITLGYMMWCLGEIIWTIYEYSLGIDPFPSIADLFYIIGYPLVFLGVLKGLKIGKINWTKKKLLISGTLILLFSIITFYFGVYYAYDSEVTTFENVIAMTYGIGAWLNLIGVILLANLSFEFKGGKFSKHFMFMGIAFFVSWIGDILYAIYYEPYEIINSVYRQIDYFWILDYIIIGFVLYSLGRTIEDIKSSITLKKKGKKNTIS